MSVRVAKSMTETEIRLKANAFREYLCFPPDGFADPLMALDRLSSRPLSRDGLLFGDYEVVDDSVDFIPAGSEAYTDYDEKKIYIRRQVVEELSLHHRGRYVESVFHEMGHLVLHCFAKGGSFLMPDDYVFKSEMEKPEKQARIFASEFALPLDFVKNMPANEMVLIYRVSPSAANKRYKEIREGTAF